jgi:hypothetical protein
MLDQKMEVSSELEASDALPQGKRSLYQLDRRPHEPQSYCGTVTMTERKMHAPAGGSTPFIPKP